MSGERLPRARLLKAVKQRTGQHVRSEQIGLWVRAGLLSTAGRDGFGKDVYSADAIDRVVELLNSERGTRDETA